MTVPDALYIEYYSEGYDLLDMQSNTILDMEGNTILDMGEWIDLAGDVLGEPPIVIFQGQRNSGPQDRVADSGSIRFTLKNGIDTSGGVVGYYSPDHASVRNRWGLGKVVRVGLESAGVIDYIAQGKIMSIDPVAGNLSNKTVDVVAADWMDIASRTTMPWIKLGDVENSRDDQVIQVILDALDDPPDSTDFDTGSYTYLYPLNDLNDGKDTVMTVLQRLAVNGLGRIYIVGNTTSGEVLKYVSKNTLVAGGTAVATFDNDFDEMELSRQAYRRAKRVIVTANGYTAYSLQQVYQLPAEVSVGAGATVEISGDFADVTGMVDLNKECPASVYGQTGSDIQFSATSGSGLNDLSANLTTVLTLGINSFKASLSNSAVVTGYLNLFNFFGSGSGYGLFANTKNVYEVEDASIPEGQGVTIQWSAPYQNTYAKAKEIGDLLMSWHGNDITEVKYLRFTPTLDAENYAKMIDCKPGTLVNVKDDVTGIDADMLAIGFELQIWNNGNLMKETLYLSRTV